MSRTPAPRARAHPPRRLDERAARLSLVVIAVAVVQALAPGRARAQTTAPRPPRPIDAPGSAPTPLPALPAQYLVEEQAGLRFAYHPATRERVRRLVPVAEKTRARLREALGRPDLLGSVEVRVAASPHEMKDLSPPGQGPRTAALALAQPSLVVMSLVSPLPSDAADPAEALRHALAHVALDEASGGRGIPAWFHEGYALHFAGDASARRAQSMCLAALRREVPALADLEAAVAAEDAASLARGGFTRTGPVPWTGRAASADFARFLLARSGSTRLPALLEAIRSGARFEPALEQAYGTTVGALDDAWRRDVAKRYSFLPVLLAGSLLWVGLAVVALVRRLRERSAARSPLRKRGSRARDAQLSLRERRGSIAVVRLRDLPPGARGGRGEALPPDADVPKVEHGGRWHTLH